VGALPDDDDGDDDGEAIPNLSQLPEEQWLDALRPLSRYERVRAQNTVPMEKVGVVGALIGELVLEAGAARARPIPAPACAPAGDPPPRGGPHPTRPRRQVNFRLGVNEHARLTEAARLFAMRPNTLARLLVVRGVERALRDARRGEA